MDIDLSPTIPEPQQYKLVFKNTEGQLEIGSVVLVLQGAVVSKPVSTGTGHGGGESLSGAVQLGFVSKGVCPRACYPPGPRIHLRVSGN